jgi:hypothetical protein
MPNPNKHDSQLADSNQNPLIGERQDLVATEAITGSSTGALTSVDLAFTWSTNDPGVTTGAATISDGASMGDDNTSNDPVSAVEDQFNKLRADLIASNVEIDALVIDVTALSVSLGLACAVLEAHGLMADA